MRMTYTQLLSVAPHCARSSAPVRHHTGEACGTVMATRSAQCSDSCCEGPSARCVAWACRSERSVGGRRASHSVARHGGRVEGFGPRLGAIARTTLGVARHEGHTWTPTPHPRWRRPLELLLEPTAPAQVYPQTVSRGPQRRPRLASDTTHTGRLYVAKSHIHIPNHDVRYKCA